MCPLFGVAEPCVPHAYLGRARPQPCATFERVTIVPCSADEAPPGSPHERGEAHHGVDDCGA